MSVRRWLMVIIAAAVAVRVVFMVLFSDTFSLNTSGYDTYAQNLIERHAYTRFDDRSADSDLPPLYPFFLAGIYQTLGRDPIAVAAVQTALDALVVLLFFGIGRRVGGDAVGLLAAALYGAYPYLIFQNLTLNDTGLFILLLAGGVWAAYRVRDSLDWRWAALMGVCFGLGALTKTLILLMPPLIAVWWWRTIGLRGAITFSLIGGGLLAFTILPWVIRNVSVQHEFVLISTNGGSNLHQGNNSCVVDYLARGWDAQWVNCLEKPPAGLSETEEDQWHQKQAISYLRENPDAWISLFWTKLWVLWSPAIMPYDLPPDPYLVDNAIFQYHTPRFEAARVVHLLYFAPLLLLALVGWISAWQKKLEIGPLLAVFVSITAAYVVFHPSTRYRSPADGFVFILSALGVLRGWAWWIGRRARQKG